MTLGVSVSPPLCLVPPTLPAHSVPVASLTSRPNPLKSAVQGLAGKAVQTERDVMKELRMEVSEKRHGCMDEFGSSWMAV